MKPLVDFFKPAVFINETKDSSLLSIKAKF